MSATKPYLQDRLLCGCYVTKESGAHWRVVDTSPACALHLRGEWIARDTSRV